MFGTLCLAGAIQFWFTYPETCGKTLEEIEVMFSDNGPRAWKTKKGHSRLTDEMEAVVTSKVKGEARDSIEKVIQHDRGVHNEAKTEAV